MREESHLDDMRAAIRGDFERLEERRGEQELMRPVAERDPEVARPPAAEAEPDPVPAPEPLVPVPAPEPEDEPVEELPEEPLAPAAYEAAPREPIETLEVPEPEPLEAEEAPSEDTVPSSDGDDAADAAESEAPPRRSWLDRLLGR